MERELWNELRRAGRRGACGTDRRLRAHSNSAVLEVHLWAALHDRPACWACRPGSWPARLRPARLPSPSTLSRRLRSPELAAALASLRVPAPPGAALVIDAKPLPVGEYTKDRDARNGRALLIRPLSNSWPRSPDVLWVRSSWNQGARCGGAG